MPLRNAPRAQGIFPENRASPKELVDSTNACGSYFLSAEGIVLENPVQLQK
eukprot:m.38132 g.38132  ORF g.38132 m.38132 type:complete len:51 (+) comp7777_c0_seq1:5098-5250(+)